jgi:hypothetical protein
MKLHSVFAETAVLKFALIFSCIYSLTSVFICGILYLSGHGFFSYPFSTYTITVFDRNSKTAIPHCPWDCCFFYIAELQEGESGFKMFFWGGRP